MAVAQRPRLERFGSLDCYVTGVNDTGHIPVVICHGYGAPGSDLVGLAAEWVHLLGEDASNFRFFFPIAPHNLAHLGMPDGRAWWPINMAQLSEKVNARKFDELHGLEPIGLPDARTALVEAIEAIQAHCGSSAEELVLGGFSQGAMITMDTAIRGVKTPPKLLMQFSGTLVCQGAWAEGMSRLANTKVFQSHGTYDPILPFDSATMLRDLLNSRQVKVTFHSFAGPHTIDSASIEVTAELLKDLV